MITELIELLQKSFRKGEQVTLHPQNGFPLLI